MTFDAIFMNINNGLRENKYNVNLIWSCFLYWNNDSVININYLDINVCFEKQLKKLPFWYQSKIEAAFSRSN